MELAAESKFCVRCLHYRTRGKSHLCSATKTTMLDMVTGEYHETSLEECSKRRKGDCGPDGVMFEHTNK